MNTPRRNNFLTLRGFASSQNVFLNLSLTCCSTVSFNTLIFMFFCVKLHENKIVFFLIFILQEIQFALNETKTIIFSIL